ncbi:MAG: DUF3365 domain-containing protein [Cyclobacteriaceae bacterium]
MRHSITTLLLVFFILGCSPEKPVDRSAYTLEKQQRELKRVMPADLVAAGEKLGKEVIEKSSAIYLVQLKRAIVINGVDGAIDHCNINLIDKLKRIEDSLGVSITRVTDKPRNPSNSLSDLEKEIWEAYEYAPNVTSAQVQEYDKEQLIVTKPILISSTLCLNCHGSKGTEIDTKTQEAINKKYPNDNATGYYTGDLRGMWRIIIPKKSVVAQL